MSRRLLGLNILLAVLSLLFVTYIVRQVTQPGPVAAPRPSAPTPAATPRAPAPAPSPQTYSIVSARNLFSPSRSETTTTQAAIHAATAVRKPNLYGVLLTDGLRIAYLEDPATRRVTSYQPGDSIGGGTVETISGDRIVILRPEGKMEVLLHDPSRPRAAAPPAVSAQAPPRGGLPARGQTPAILGPRPPSPDATPR